MNDGKDWEDLWFAEASHRAKNFAQLAVLKEELKRRHALRFPVDDTEESLLVGLCEAYQDLHTVDGDQFGPCQAALIRVAGGLTALFGQVPCNVRLTLEIDEMRLELRRRRALVLLASELVMNSIKHAYQGRISGNLLVRLQRRSIGELMVVDDGIGIGPNYCEGQGTALVKGLCSILNGEISRSTLGPRGLVVSVSFPIGLTYESF